MAGTNPLRTAGSFLSVSTPSFFSRNFHALREIKLGVETGNETSLKVAQSRKSWVQINTVAPLLSQGLQGRHDEPREGAVECLKTIHNCFRFYYHSPAAVMKVGGANIAWSYCIVLAIQVEDFDGSVSI